MRVVEKKKSLGKLICINEYKGQTEHIDYFVWLTDSFFNQSDAGSKGTHMQQSPKQILQIADSIWSIFSTGGFLFEHNQSLCYRLRAVVSIIQHFH